MNPADPNDIFGGKAGRIDQRSRIIRRHLEQMRPFFDSVQIIATLVTENDTVSVMFEDGIGNKYARRGSVQAWLNQAAEYDRMTEMVKHVQPTKREDHGDAETHGGDPPEPPEDWRPRDPQ